MKDKIVYILIFVIVFGAVTGGIVYFNSIYNNIFWFDFSPVKTQLGVKDKKNNEDRNIQDSLKAKENELAEKDSSQVIAAKIDTSKANETSKDITKTTSETKNDNIPVKKNVSAIPVTFSPTQIPLQTATVENLSKAKKDSMYNSWIKETVKLYESMDSRKAAKVIQGYSDNIARDIILKMKKKKAAEILAEIKPEVVTRIISVNP